MFTFDVKRIKNFDVRRNGAFNHRLNQNQQSHHHSTSTDLPNIIVVGAGLAGLATSLGLINSGLFQVDLVEVRPDFNRQGATFALAPNGRKALEELDPEIDQGSNVITKLDALGVNTTLGNRHGLLLGWWMVRNALLERAQQSTNNNHLLRLHMGYTLHDIVDDPSKPNLQATFRKVSLHIRKRTKDPHRKPLIFDGLHEPPEEQEDLLKLEGCLLVGADGIHSSIRSFLQLAPAQAVGSIVWRGSVKVEDPANPNTKDPDQHQVLVPLLDRGTLPVGFRTFGPTLVAIFNFHGRVPGAMSWIISTKADDAPQYAHVWDTALKPFMDLDSNDKDDDSDYDRQVLQAMLHISNPDDVCHPTMYCVVQPPVHDGRGWGGKGRIILIGDAAHAMRATGQGGNVAFEDCAVLCRILQQRIRAKDSGVMAQYDQVAELVLAMENERLRRVRKIWNTEQQQAEQTLVKDGTSLMTPEYVEWLYEGA